MEGKDEAYDEISAEIAELEDGLEKELKKLKKQLGCVHWPICLIPPLATDRRTRYRCDLTYWHSAQGTKVGFNSLAFWNTRR